MSENRTLESVSFGTSLMFWAFAMMVVVAIHGAANTIAAAIDRNTAECRAAR